MLLFGEIGCIESKLYYYSWSCGHAGCCCIRALNREESLICCSSLPIESGKSTLFAELFKADGDKWDHLQSLPVDGTPVFSVLDKGEYLILLQPALKQAINYRFGFSIGGSLPFPVEGKDQRAIWSFFGDPRDGGRRAHHGVDIFAKRGTPVYAVTEGRVRTHTTPRGGQVIWLQDADRNLGYYYAHLDGVHVASGQRVISGDVIGTVGNTGNAVSTPPHLHFGIYARFSGPVDPLPYIRPPPQTAVLPDLDTPSLGMQRVTASMLRLRSGPSTRAAILKQLPNGRLLRAVANVGDWYRVKLAEGEQGFVSAQWIEPLPSTAQPL
jgi:peptidoglycan LD-endopeptidase LytH